MSTTQPIRDRANARKVLASQTGIILRNSFPQNAKSTAESVAEPSVDFFFQHLVKRPKERSDDVF